MRRALRLAVDTFNSEAAGLVMFILASGGIVLVVLYGGAM